MNNSIKTDDIIFNFFKQICDEKDDKKCVELGNSWINAMENYKTKFNIYKFFIVTDDYRYAKNIFPKLKIIHGDIGKCYASIYNSSNIILSNSSFSYFPCRTGIKKRIIAPIPIPNFINVFLSKAANFSLRSSTVMFFKSIIRSPIYKQF